MKAFFFSVNSRGGRGSEKMRWHSELSYYCTLNFVLKKCIIFVTFFVLFTFHSQESQCSE